MVPCYAAGVGDGCCTEVFEEAGHAWDDIGKRAQSSVADPDLRLNRAQLRHNDIK